MMGLYDFIKNKRRRSRLSEIIHVFYEEEFGFLLSKINLHQHLPFQKRIKARIAQDSKIKPEERLRHAFERLGPTFIKFGQLLSLRPDLIPPKYVEEFEKMQDHVPPFSFQQAKTIIEEELKQPLNKIFTQFEQKPIASASMSQVYRAKIGKETVAVKVQRPDIQQTIETDIDIMYKIAGLLEQHWPVAKEYHLMGIIREFEKWTLKELNFRIEAYYAQKIANNFKESKILKIPKVYSQYSTSKVLTMEFLEGVPLHDVAELKRRKVNIKKVVQDGYYIILKQVFMDGLFHADPHPGNILILKNGRIGLIDFGILGHFDKKLKRSALDLLRSFLENNPEKATEVILRMNGNRLIDKEPFRNEIRNLFEQLCSTPVEDLKFGILAREVIAAANKYHIDIPTDFVLFGKTLAITEGIALRYQPDFNFYHEAQTMLKKLFNTEYLAKETLTRTKDKLGEYVEFAQQFPDTARELLEKAKNFQMKIDINDNDVQLLAIELEHSSGNLALGFIIAALIVASALLMQANKGQVLYFIGFVLAGVLSLWLIHRTLFVKTKK